MRGIIFIRILPLSGPGMGGSPAGRSGRPPGGKPSGGNPSIGWPLRILPGIAPGAPGGGVWELDIMILSAAWEWKIRKPEM
jgi:hypothetical protein